MAFTMGNGWYYVLKSFKARKTTRLNLLTSTYSKCQKLERNLSWLAYRIKCILKMGIPIRQQGPYVNNDGSSEDGFPYA